MYRVYRVYRGSRGFTLIELLVVIVIVAVLTSVVTLNFNFRNVSKSIQDESLRIGLLMQYAADQAVYSRTQLGVRFHPASYEFYLLTESEDPAIPASWEMVDDDRLATSQSQEPVVFEVDIEGIPIVLETLTEERNKASEENPIKPHVLFLSNGEVLPDFRIVVSDEEGRYQHQIYAGEDEPIIVEPVE